MEMTMNKSKKRIAVGVSALLLTSAATAWVDDTDELAKFGNKLCKFEPEAQCSWAVHTGVQAAGVDMHNASMSSIRLDKANFQGANLSHATIQLANLSEINLMLANLEGAHMHAVNLSNANLMMANLKGVNLLDANLSGANLRGANLEGAILFQAKLDNATWTDGRTCAVGSIGKCL